MKKIIFSVIFLNLFLACSWLTPAVIKVGDYRITQKELDVRVKVNQLYYPQYTGKLADSTKEQLRQVFVKAMILKKYGVELESELLEKEAERIEKSTQNPEMLKKIQALFQNDRGLYLKLFVLPTFVERTIYFQLFLNDEKIQGLPKKQAEAYLSALIEGKVKWGESFAGTAPQLSKYYLNQEDGFRIHTERGVVVKVGSDFKDVTKEPNQKVKEHLQKMQKNRAKSDYEFWTKNYLAELSPDELQKTAVIGKVIDYDQNFLLLKYIGKKGNAKKTEYMFEAISFPKRDFSQWLDEEQKQILH